MSWLYAPGLVPCPSESAFAPPDTPPPVTLRGKPIASRSWPRAWKKVCSLPHLSGAISRPSTLERSAAAWISSLQDSRASRTASPGKDSPTRTIVLYGPSSCGSSESASQDWSSLRTSQPSETTLSLFGESFETWVSSGPRLCFRPPQSPVRRISESDSMPLLPTPSASSYGTNRGGSAGRTGPARPGLDTLVRSAPTPAASDWKGASQPGQRRGQIGDWILSLPTPRASPNENRTTRHAPSHGNGHGKTLAGEVAEIVSRLPTVTVGDAHGSGAAGYSTESGRHSGTTLTDAVTGAASKGRSGILNPRLSEWMQGLPRGWTSLGPLGTSAHRLWLTRERSSLFYGDSHG